MTNEEMDEYPTFSDKWEKNIVYFNKIKAQAKLANAQQSIIDRCEPWLKHSNLFRIRLKRQGYIKAI